MLPLTCPRESASATEIESSFEFPCLSLKHSQQYPQSIANDLGHIFVSEVLTDFSNTFPVGFGQSNGSRFQLRTDAKICTLVSVPAKALYGACIPLLSYVVAFGKRAVA